MHWVTFSRSPSRARHYWLVACSLLMIFWQGRVEAADGVQISPDGKQTLVNKAVGGERWAIARAADDRSITGNVFSTDGGPPQFVWCSPAGASSAEERYSCYGADRCPKPDACGAPEQWKFISDVSLPDAFFSPSATSDPEPIPGCSVEPGQRVTANNSEWVIVEVPITLEDSPRTYALRYPVRISDGILASQISGDKLRKRRAAMVGIAPGIVQSAGTQPE